LSFKLCGHSTTVESVTLIHSSPRILLLSVQYGPLLVYFLNFHAPQCDAKACWASTSKMSNKTRTIWWKTLLKLCKSLNPQFPLFVFCDSNATVGSITSTAIGSLSPELDNANSVQFASFLNALNLFLPSTFSHYHSGPSRTYTTSSSNRRIDYIAIPNSLTVWSLRSTVLPIALSIIKDDHWSPSLKFNVFFDCSPVQPLFPHRVAICDRALISILL
jgi:hypothetical protein